MFLMSNMIFGNKLVSAIATFLYEEYALPARWAGPNL